MRLLSYLTTLREQHAADSPPSHYAHQHQLAHTQGTTTTSSGNGGNTRTHTLNKLSRMAALARPNFIDKSALPYSCGLIFYCHITCTGGTTINNFLLEQSEVKNGSAPYFTFYGVREKTVEEKNSVERAFINGMNKHVQNISSNEWRISHAHTNSMHLNASEEYLFNWRSTVEAQGCQFIVSIMFRDPLIHTLAKHAWQVAQNIPREEYISHLKVKDKLSPPGIEAQIDFFLYNLVVRNPFAVSTQAKIDRALEILVRHFNIVTVGGHNVFKERLQKITGWEEKDMPRKNSNTRDDKLIFSKPEIDNLQKLMRENGDIDFMENVKLIFEDPVYDF